MRQVGRGLRRKEAQSQTSNSRLLPYPSPGATQRPLDTVIGERRAARIEAHNENIIMEISPRIIDLS